MFYLPTFSACAKVLLAQMSDLLYLLGEISGKTIFIDGTKMESAANKYTFVWKRAITKKQARLYTKLTSFVVECEELYGIRTVYHDQASLQDSDRKNGESSFFIKDSIDFNG